MEANSRSPEGALKPPEFAIKNLLLRLFPSVPYPGFIYPGNLNPSSRFESQIPNRMWGKKKPESVISMLWCCLIGGDYNFPSVPRGAWGGLEKLENLVASAIPGISELWDRGAAPRGVFPHSWTSLFWGKWDGSAGGERNLGASLCPPSVPCQS